MSADKTKVLNILEMRYDYQSSRNVLSNWRKAAGIRDDSDTLNDEALKSLLAYLKENAADAVRVHAAVERMILSDNKEDAPVVEDAKVEVVPVVDEVIDAPVVEEVVEEVKAEDAVVEDVVVEDTAADDASADENKAEDAPAETGKKKKKSKH